jgi:uncharacterized membrane protein
MFETRKMLRLAVLICLAALLIAALTLAPTGPAIAAVFLFCFFSTLVVSSPVPRIERVHAQQIASLPLFSPRPPPLR